MIAQDPPSTSAVAPNATVTVTIGSGMTMVTVPKGIVGMDVAAATAMLEQAKLAVVTEEGDSAEPANEVIAVDQRAGDKVPEGTPVTLTISNNSRMAMPNVQNQTPTRPSPPSGRRGGRAMPAASPSPSRSPPTLPRSAWC